MFPVSCFLSLSSRSIPSKCWFANTVSSSSTSHYSGYCPPNCKYNELSPSLAFLILHSCINIVYSSETSLSFHDISPFCLSSSLSASSSSAVSFGDFSLYSQSTKHLSPPWFCPYRLPLDILFADISDMLRTVHSRGPNIHWVIK